MRHVVLSFISLLILSFSWAAFASSSIKIVNPTPNYISHLNSWTNITRSDVFIFMWKYYAQYAPDSYRYIDIKFTWVQKNSDLYKSLQVLVYLDLIKNSNANLYPQKWLVASDFYTLSHEVFWVDFRNEDISSLKSRYTNISDLIHVSDAIVQITSKTQEVESSSVDIDISSWSDNQNIAQKKAIFSDVYKTITSRHYDKATLNEEEMIYSAIQWLAKWTDDKYTTYFPPVENKDFQESLSGEYEWIGSYVEMPQPGLIQIVSPIVWSPSESAGIKGWDIITKIDDFIITDKVSLKEAISYIKWPAGTSVVLTIKRWSQILTIKVTRAKIVIKEVEYEAIKNDTFYIQVKTFWDSVDREFEQALQAMKANTSIKKVIIDLRNNPGWYLGKVNNMLGHFVEKWEPVSIVKYQKSWVVHRSKWGDIIDFSDYKIIFLQNGGTASASEILVGTVKDYYPDAVIVWETSFGKWSVQDIKSYADGSSLKFTIAKWFTGKTENGIDGVGISPDIEIKLDDEKIKRSIDNQLNRALQVR